MTREGPIRGNDPEKEMEFRQNLAHITKVFFLNLRLYFVFLMYFELALTSGGSFGMDGGLVPPQAYSGSISKKKLKQGKIAEIKVELHLKMFNHMGKESIGRVQ